MIPPHPHVLVVEDESIVAWGLQQTLNTLGYVVPGIASSGKAALKMADEHHLDLVIMDIVLRGPMDGIEAAIQLRSRFDLPILYLTAYYDDQTLERAKPTEPYGYLVKPFLEQDLRIGLKMALNKHAREKHRIAKTPQRSKRTTTRSCCQQVSRTTKSTTRRCWSSAVTCPTAPTGCSLALPTSRTKRSPRRST